MTKQKTIYLIIFTAIVVILVAVLTTLFRGFLGSRALPPSLTEEDRQTLNGSVAIENLEPGVHTLEFQAVSSDGRIITETRTFEITSDDATDPEPPNPYGP